MEDDNKELLSKLLADRGQNQLTEEEFWTEMERANLTQDDIDAWAADHRPLGAAFLIPPLWKD